ncbi:YheC/YheD family endospore coat-associated protein [Ferdinandcohnia sp. Marseille-Q9671]
MITLYYHIKKQEWFQCEEPNGLTFGKTKDTVSYVGSKPKQSLPFLVKRLGDTAGPLVGILIGSSDENSYIGNLPVLRNLLLSIQKHGALGVLLTPDSLKENQMEALTFYKPLQKWIKLRTPLPNAIYNRIPYRTMEKSQKFKEIVSYFKANKIPFFNPSFFSKWDTFQILQSNDYVRNFLPETILLKQKQDLEQMLKKHRELYIKSSVGHKGIGLYRIKYNQKGVVVETIHGKQSYASLSSFWNVNNKVFSNEEFLLQRSVEADTFKEKRYDLRILCHYGDKGHFISGIGVRLAGTNGFTTHVPNGGTILPYHALRSRFNEDTLQQLCFEIGKELMRQTGEFIGEFSIDLGRSVDGAIFIYEINSKPMIFDETHIKKKGLENLTKLLIMKGTKA